MNRAVRFGLLLTVAISMHTANAQQIWFDPHAEGSPDFMSLFRPDAPWRRAASAVRVFEISSGVALRAPESDLRQIIADLRRRGIDLLVGMGPLSGSGDSQSNCGYHVEGYAAPGEPLAEAERLKAMGGEPRYFGMDGPLYFGHVYGKPGWKVGCHTPIPELAKDVATKVRQIRKLFPNAQIGDVEPLTAFPKDTFLQDLELWIDRFKEETGTNLAFYRLDLAWREGWRERIPALRALLKQKGIPFQVIYDGNGDEKSDATAIDNTIANFKAFESEGRSPPDAAVFQFWTPHPSRILPETDPTAVTYLINAYVDWHRSGAR